MTEIFDGTHALLITNVVLNEKTVDIFVDDA